MRPCSILRPNGDKVPAHVIRFGPKNSRVTFNADRDCSELVPTVQIYEIIEETKKEPSDDPLRDLCLRVDDLDAKMEAALAQAGVLAASIMSVGERIETIRGLRDDRIVIIEGECWSREEAEEAGAVQPKEPAQAPIAA
jgi:hypothetical protein